VKKFTINNIGYCSNRKKIIVDNYDCLLVKGGIKCVTIIHNDSTKIMQYSEIILNYSIIESEINRGIKIVKFIEKNLFRFKMNRLKALFDWHPIFSDITHPYGWSVRDHFRKIFNNNIDLYGFSYEYDISIKKSINQIQLKHPSKIFNIIDKYELRSYNNRDYSEGINYWETNLVSSNQMIRSFLNAGNPQMIINIFRDVDGVISE
jgi:hypothetical protein